MENIPTLLNESIKNNFRTEYLKGKEIKQILLEMEIPEGTWNGYLWQNKYGLRDWYQDIKREYLLQEAERVSKEILNIKDAKNNAKILSIIQKEAEFLRETQGKEQGYSKRLETIGLNINKNEPLDDDQKEKLNKLLRATGSKQIKEGVIVETTTLEEQP